MFLFFKVVLATLGPLFFNMSFWINFSISEKVYWDFDGDCVESIDQSEEN